MNRQILEMPSSPTWHYETSLSAHLALFTIRIYLHTNSYFQTTFWHRWATDFGSFNFNCHSIKASLLSFSFFVCVRLMGLSIENCGKRLHWDFCHLPRWLHCADLSNAIEVQTIPKAVIFNLCFKHNPMKLSAALTYHTKSSATKKCKHKLAKNGFWKVFEFFEHDLTHFE